MEKVAISPIVTMTKEWTLDEFAMEFWGNLPEYQFEANLIWLRDFIRVLKVGGIWTYPQQQMVLRKIDEDRLRLLEGTTE